MVFRDEVREEDNPAELACRCLVVDILVDSGVYEHGLKRKISRQEMVQEGKERYDPNRSLKCYRLAITNRYISQYAHLVI
jgi:hypothetical protein